MGRDEGRQLLGVSLKSGAARNVGDGIMHLFWYLLEVSLQSTDTDVALPSVASHLKIQPGWTDVVGALLRSGTTHLTSLGFRIRVLGGSRVY